MATMLDSLKSSITPETLGALGQSLGLDADSVSQGLAAVGPLLQSGVAQSASTPQGVDALGGLLGSLPDALGDDPVGALTGALGNPEGLGGMLGGLLGGGSGGGMDLGGMLGGLLGGGSGGSGGADLGGMLGGLLGGSGGGAAAAGGAALAGILGGMLGGGGGSNDAISSGVNAIGGELSKRLGFNITPVLVAAVPMVLGMIKKQQKARNLDNASMAREIQMENDAFMNSGSPEAVMLKEVQAVGQQAVKTRDAFQGEDWETVRMAPLAVAGLVMAASPSKWSGAAAELGAGVKVVTDARGAASPASLLAMAFGQSYSDDELDTFSMDINKEKALTTIKSAVSVVSSKSASEAADYKAMLAQVGTAVAEATKEGGFLGIGGKRVSDAEAAILSEIGAVLNG